MKPRSFPVRFLFLPVLVAGALSSRAAEARYTLTDLGLKTQGHRLNASGEVIGARYAENGDTAAFLFSKGEMHLLGTLGGKHCRAAGLSDTGEIVGVSWLKETGPNGRPQIRPFLHAGGVMRELTPTGLPDGIRLREASDINRSGVVIGITDERLSRLCFLVQGRAALVALPEGFVKPDEMGTVEVKRINQAGQTIGTMHAFKMVPVVEHVQKAVGPPTHGFLATVEGIKDLGEYLPRDINAEGRIVGSFRAAEGKAHAALYDGSAWQDLGVPAGFENSTATGINASGQIVGEAHTITGHDFLRIDMNSHAFLHDRDGWHDLNERVDFTGTGLTKLFRAEGINDAGQILCQAMGPGGIHAVLLTPVGSNAAAK